MRPIRGMETRNRLVTYPRVVVENREYYLVYMGAPLRSKGLQLHTPGLQSQHMAVKISEDCVPMRWSVAENPGVLLKDPCTGSLTGFCTGLQ